MSLKKQLEDNVLCKQIDLLLQSMQSSELRNYIVPGLSSWLVSDDMRHGNVRLFRNEREQLQTITPHSHRYDFAACVIRGHALNTIWRTPMDHEMRNADMFIRTEVIYEGEPGNYRYVSNHDPFKYVADSTVYQPGDWYYMKRNEIHSIAFSRDALVLFLEGPTTGDHSYMLEPFQDGKHLRTMRIEDWMFKRGAK